MLDRDLAELYWVKTKVLKQAVRRNISRFPEDFMFELTKEEFENWRLQFVTSNSDKMGLRYNPFVFTEQGVAMLSSVLNSERAIMVNIQIMRIFTKFRKILASDEELRKKIETIERKVEGHDVQIKAVFDAISSLMTPPTKEQKKIGFKKDQGD
ncbi:MAG: ORF6N domain-containing protein [bacterium]